MTLPAKWKRRAFLAAGAVGLYAWVRYLPQLPVLFGPGLGYTPIPGLAPFRELDSNGTASTGSAIFAGIDPPKDERWRDLLPGLRQNPCSALFPFPVTGAVPVAVFTDYDCPNCRLLDRLLAAYAEANPGTIRVVQHQLPLLGPGSVLAARAVLAARLQGKEAELDRRLKRARIVADTPTLVGIAGQVGLDTGRLERDMTGAQVQRMLDRDRALAALFGFYATPGTVAGRTTFLGALPAPTLARLIAAEKALPPLSCGAA